jgi:uncharacterized protein (TIGR00661 family)
MKVLYAIQGTGNGHVSRAREIVPVLARLADVDVLLSGIQSDIDFPYPIKYSLHGLSFIFGKNGGINIFETIKKARLNQLRKEINSLPVGDYDLIINDFEPVSAWAAKRKNIPLISLSHQSAVLNEHAPEALKSDILGKFILKKYAPSEKSFGFHFRRYDNHIFTPVIRSEIRNLKTRNKGHYTVYLPAYSDERLIDFLVNFPQTKWQIFSKHSKEAYKIGNMEIQPVSNDMFIQSMADSEGVLCGAGFETPAEALFWKKKLLVIPMKGQYEQQCNAGALKEMGVPVIPVLHERFVSVVENWLKTEQSIIVDYPNETEKILRDLLSDYNSLTHEFSHPHKKSDEAA